ncbi:glutathione S-transferase N-terminal domain-containing protein [Alcanivorax quisquiliarum]|uniref:Glutathione S-transferase N-terminal domain-containing protein n=1 Tax=Alcanivorax quisquiliarum TaxID=2933565 RepID=A0ABT0EAF6_9GAMM|nr:glutathione S-transferase N-terminal domain-containing protein [Alcanivorax quisquiliarum]MCK0538789.1 glutathione S-transferase N-terminal domain-containing protein [Alcanivorax quisquiliarum]
MRAALDFSTSMLATLSEQGRGVQSRAAGRQPSELLELYDMEGCPFCRLVREALTDLDLDAMIYPCPKGGTRFRPLVEKLGGLTQFPFLMDPNTDEALYESADIIAYLYREYGSRPAPRQWLTRSVHTAGSFGASALRHGRGLRAQDGQLPAEPLELYSFEASPFARPVRELLTELELPYILRQMGRTQAADWLLPALRERVAPDYVPTQRNRAALLARTGRVAVPYLIDPNTGTELFESADILRYLNEQYR